MPEEVKFDLKHFKKNPVLLEGHDCQKPIGKCKMEGDTMVITTETAEQAKMIREGLVYLTYGFRVSDEGDVDITHLSTIPRRD